MTDDLFATVTDQAAVTLPAALGVVLSLFPGADLLGQGFERVGYCVVRGPDPILGGDIRNFTGRFGMAEGVIGGPPCVDFSRVNRDRDFEAGCEMIRQYLRVVFEVMPEWFLMENVPTVPDVVLAGYSVQRFDLRADEFGVSQARLRHFQFGSKSGVGLVIARGPRIPNASHTVLATEGLRPGRRSFSEVCSLQGLREPLSHPYLTKSGRYAVVGNGVPVPVAEAIARAISVRSVTDQGVRTCLCGCARSVTGRQTLALASCRKRMQRRRDGSSFVTVRM